MNEAKKYVERLLENYPSLEVNDFAINKSLRNGHYLILINIEKIEYTNLGIKIK